LAAAFLLLAPERAHAQPDAIRERLEWSLGAGANGPVRFDSVDAALQSPSGAPFALFQTDARLGWAAAYSTRVAVRLTNSLQLEASGSLRPGTLTVSIRGDSEEAASATLRESVRQLVFEGSIVSHIRARPLGPRYVPFVTLGAGRFWDIHEGDRLAEVGHHVFVGAGVKRVLRTRPKSRAKALGLRADVRLVVRDGGGGLDDNVHVFPAIGGSVFVRF
jgi:hypothetical protein